MNSRRVLISGAGIAGPMLAFWLSRAGFEPTLVECAPALRSGGYVIDFWGLGYDLAERMGLLEEINRAGYHMRELRILDDRGARISGFGTGVFRELTGGRYVTLSRSDLSRLLFDKARPTTESIFGDEIVSLTEVESGVVARFRHGSDRKFDLVIGADGLHSAVRRLVFGPQREFEKKLGYMVAAFEVSGFRPRDDDIYLLYGQPGRMLGRFTLRDDRTLFLFVFADDGATVPVTRDQQKSLLRARYADAKWEGPRILDEVERTSEFYFDSVSQIRMRRWSEGRVALVGDAAFCVSLLAGQGSALAMISAYVLAGELARSPDCHADAFARYQDRLDAFINRKQLAAARFGAAFAPKTRRGLAFRNLVVRAMGIPGVSKLVFGGDITDSLTLPDYPWRG